MDDSSAIEDVASDVNNSAYQGPEPTCDPIKEGATTAKCIESQQSEKLICRHFENLSADSLMRDGINKLRKVFDEGTEEGYYDNVNNFFELIEKSANTTLYKDINFYMNLNNCYEEQSNKVFIAHVKKAICSMAYARDLESLLKSGSNYYYEVIEAVGGENKHQKLKRLGDRMIKLIHQCGVGSLLLLQYVSLSQIQKFRNDQFDVILYALLKDYHFVWDEFRAALDSCLLTKLVKRITGNISLSFSAVPSSVGAMTTPPAQLEDQGPATMITAVPSSPPNLNLNEALPAVGSKRAREESSN